MPKKTRKITKKFHTNKISRRKYDYFRNIAMACRDRRNIVSSIFFEKFWEYMNLPGNRTYIQTTFVKAMWDKFNIIGTYIDQGLYRNVFRDYYERFELMKEKMTFKQRTFVKFKLFERDCKKGKKGELDKCIYREESTVLSQVLSFLARYGDFDIVDRLEKYLLTDIKEVLKSPDKSTELKKEESKREFFWIVLEYIDKYSLSRLLRIATQRKDLVTRRYNSKPIEYKSLTFEAYCCYTCNYTKSGIFISYNKNYNSDIKAFLSLTLPGAEDKNGRCEIPIKYAKDYHNDIRYYKEHKKKYIFFQIEFNEWDKELIIDLFVDEECKEINIENLVSIGGDTNIKHSMIHLSDDMSFDYDRNVIDKCIKTKERCERAKKINRQREDIDNKLGKRNARRSKAAKRAMKGSTQSKVVEVCKYIQSNNYNHLVLEDLQKTFKKSKAKTEEDIKYNMLMDIVNMSSIKDEFEHIAKNYGIIVSFVPSEYTSVMCPVCGCISNSNRKVQEIFNCVHCGHTDNADHNAAVNILNRVESTVLAHKLLKQNEDKSYSPKNVSHTKVKEILSSYSTDTMDYFDNHLSCSFTNFSVNNDT